MAKALRTYENWTIRTGYLTGNLLDGQEVEGIDEEASVERCAGPQECFECDCRTGATCI